VKQEMQVELSYKQKYKVHYKPSTHNSNKFDSNKMINYKEQSAEECRRMMNYEHDLKNWNAKYNVEKDLDYYRQKELQAAVDYPL
jgi:hypothetical protein